MVRRFAAGSALTTIVLGGTPVHAADPIHVTPAGHADALLNMDEHRGTNHTAKPQGYDLTTATALDATIKIHSSARPATWVGRRGLLNTGSTVSTIGAMRSPRMAIRPAYAATSFSAHRSRFSFAGLSSVPILNQRIVVSRFLLSPNRIQVILTTRF